MLTSVDAASKGRVATTSSSNLVEAIHFHVIATAHRENGQFKYKFGTPQEVKETMFAVWDADNVGGEGHITSERIIHDIDRVRSSIITIIEHSGIVVHELDVRHGYRKDNLSENKIQSLSPEAQKGLQEQLAAARGMSGPKQCNT